jgi:hypothetical protein
MTAYLDRLRPGGLLVISAPLNPIPQDLPRLTAILAAVLEAHGLEPRNHLAGLRDWRTGLLMAARDPLTAGDVRTLREFSERHAFDLILLPGLEMRETNRFHVRRDAPLAPLLRDLSGRDGRSPMADYPFDLTPPTDDRPFFYRTLRPGSVGRLAATLGPDWPRHVGWGVLLGVAMVPVLGLLALILVPLPLRLGGVRGLEHREAPRYLVAFTAIGFGFMGLEIALLDAWQLLLGDPTYAAAAVIGGMLLGAGTGSLLVRSSATTPWARSIPLCGVPALVLVLLATPLFRETAAWNPELRLVVGALLAALAAVPLGIPLPAGLARARARGSGAVAWALGINGFASVLAATLAALAAPYLGLRLLALAGAVCYIAAWRFLPRSSGSPDDSAAR